MVILALDLYCSLCEPRLIMSVAAGAFSGGARRGGGGGGGQSGGDDRRLFSKSKDKEGAGSNQGRDGSGPTSITASLMFHAMAHMSPSGGGSANNDAKDGGDPQIYLDNDKAYHHHHHDMAYDYDG